MTQKTSKAQTMTRLAPDLKKRAEAEARRQNRSLSNLIELALREYVERKEDENAQA